MAFVKEMLWTVDSAVVRLEGLRTAAEPSTELKAPAMPIRP